MNALLVLSACLSPLVNKRTFASGLSIFLLIVVGAPLLGALSVLISWWRIPTHPLFWLGIAGLAFWFGEYATRFARAHKTEIIARSHTRPWPRTSAAFLFVLSFLLFAGLVSTAGSLGR